MQLADIFRLAPRRPQWVDFRNSTVCQISIHRRVGVLPSLNDERRANAATPPEIKRQRPR